MAPSDFTSEPSNDSDEVLYGMDKRPEWSSLKGKFYKRKILFIISFILLNIGLLTEPQRMSEEKRDLLRIQVVVGCTLHPLVTQPQKK